MPTQHRDLAPGPLGPPEGTVVVLVGGDRPHPDLVLPPRRLVVAADSGAHWAAALGVSIDLLVGDLDSVAPDVVAGLEADGATVERHPRDKDATDVELALAAAAATDPALIVVVGGHGGRLDHALATMGALAGVAHRDRAVEAWMGPAHVTMAAGPVTVATRRGELVSLIPLGGPVGAVSTSGLRWSLDGADLASGSTRGVSNEATGATARVVVGSGVLAVVRPHALDPEADAGPVPARSRTGGAP